MFVNDTIAAIATGLTDSGIGIIRISGENAVQVGDRIFRSPSGKAVLKNAQSHVLSYGYAVSSAERKADYFIIDEVMAVVMKAPRSFTGEDTVEIQCHGGVFVMKKILDVILMNGARLADPGEFTKRAFLNGRIDLTRAEAVMDMINAQNEYALASSVSQLKGDLENKVRDLRNQIIYEIAFIESALDDPEHISLDNYETTLKEKIDHMLRELERLISTADDGRLIKEGINTVILGKPNAGKSSLLNILVGEDRAIVTEVAGTTRDILQETINLHGITLHITDTAGIRNTEDTVEKIGVEKARKYAKEADLILYVVDGSADLDENDMEIISTVKEKNMIVLLNKADLNHVITENQLKEVLNGILENDADHDKCHKYMIISTSMKDGTGIEEFEECVRNIFFHGQIKVNQQLVITNVRHKEALSEAFSSLELVRKSIEAGMPEDFYSIDLMNAYSSLGRIIGEEVDDDLVEEIFSKFCMGK
ncbi:MAG: tRNA uridine-5-carboxymethylaminomethyl(34) synthesis GTPase MnmE [Acetatifactor sp.]|nr:tRNA uridine-5-carboxymethylaminomethyl(34) synthesis GTPase MnmE [Acetatifactor sp.]